MISAWIDSFSAGALMTCLLMVVITILLVRSSWHPTTFALVAWPGTLAHELCHFIVGVVLAAKPSSFSLLPKPLGDGRWELGSVGFRNITWWNGPWVAMAPLLLAPLSFWLAVNWVYPVWDLGNTSGALWRLLLCSLLLQASWPSTTDFRVALPGLIILGIAAFLVWR